MRRPSTGFLFSLGLLLMIVSMGLQTVTVAPGHYGMVLSVAFALMLAADLCLLPLVRQRNWRIAALIVMAPTIWILLDLARRVL